MNKDIGIEKFIQSEKELLERLKNEHRPYFNALMYVINVLVDRNHKYTGDEGDRDVFANFELDAKIQGIETQESFRQWVAKKTARIMINDKDYGDESFTDSLRDLVNYSLLWIGYIFSLKSNPIASESVREKRQSVGHTDYQPPEKVD